MTQYDIYGIGAALVDTELEVSESDLTEFNIDKGVMTLVDEDRQAELIAALESHLVHSKRASGGSAANTVIAASYFGSKAFYSCKVANDENGAFYLNDLRDAGVDYPTNTGDKAGTTGKCLVMITPDAERTMNTFLGASETISTAELDLDALAQSRFAYIEGYLVTSATGKPAAIALREAAQAAGVKVALSLSDPAIVEYFHAGLQEMIGSGVDLLFCNEAEALAYTQTTDIDAACAALKKVSKAFVVTQGAKGALIFDGSNSQHVAGCEAKAVDTNGAGDMFAGAFIHAICNDNSYADAAAFANRAAAVVVSQYGPRLQPEQHATLLG